MSNPNQLLRAAIELVRAMNKTADENLPQNLAGIVKTHAAIAVGSAFIPVPGADMAAAAANVWAMYVRINKELGLPFSENIIKSVAAGVVTNIGAAVAGVLIVGSAAKLFPGLGTLGGGAIVAGTIYGVTMASGIVYMKAVAKLLQSKERTEFTEADLRSAADEVLKDKVAMNTILKEGKVAYKNRHE
jgi:uncharacterized protein (DUF697 family)